MKYDARACKFNMDTGCVELLLRDGRKISINCTGVEDAFRPALAAGGSLMAYKCLPLCRFRGFTAGFCKNFVQRFQKFKMRFQGKAKNFDLFRMRKKFRI